MGQGQEKAMDLVGLNPDVAFENDEDVVNGEDPFALFGEWLALAHIKEINDANAMAIATSDTVGLPNVRMVLLKGFDSNGFVFFTNTESQKGVELLANMQAAAVLHWKSLRRQVRLRGQVMLVTEDEADAYFASRPRASRIGAWASRQSRPLAGRHELRKAVAVQAVKYALGAIPRPRHWTGFRIVPTYMEFWMDKPYRLHDRLVFTRNSQGAPWSSQRYYP